MSRHSCARCPELRHHPPHHQAIHIYAAGDPITYVDSVGDCSAQSAGEAPGGAFGLVGGAESAGEGTEIGAEAATLAAGLTGGPLVVVGVGALVLGGVLIGDAVSGC